MNVCLVFILLLVLLFKILSSSLNEGFDNTCINNPKLPFTLKLSDIFTYDQDGNIEVDSSSNVILNPNGIVLDTVDNDLKTMPSEILNDFLKNPFSPDYNFMNSNGCTTLRSLS